VVRFRKRYCRSMQRPSASGRNASTPVAFPARTVLQPTGRGAAGHKLRDHENHARRPQRTALHPRSESRHDEDERVGAEPAGSTCREVMELSRSDRGPQARRRERRGETPRTAEADAIGRPAGPRSTTPNAMS